MAKEDLPISKYPSLMAFQKLQGCNDLTNIAVAKNATYHSRTAAEEFLECISEVIHNNTVRKLKESKMFAILGG